MLSASLTRPVLPRVKVRTQLTNLEVHAPKVVVVQCWYVFLTGTGLGGRVQQFATLLEVTSQILELRLQEERRGSL